MKRGVIQFACLLLLPSILLCQTLGQDEDGFSSLVVPSAVLNLDLANEIASFSYVDYFGKNNGLLLGGEIKGKSENGISNIFDNNELVSKASLNLLIGHYLDEEVKENENQRKAKNKLRDEIHELSNELGDTRNEILRVLQNEYIENFSEQLGEFLTATLLREFQIEEDIGILRQYRGKVLDAAISYEKKTKENKIDEEKLNREEIMKAFKYLDSLISSHISYFKNIEQKKNQWEELDVERKYYGSLIYGRVTADGTTYREDAGNNAQTLDERFPKTNFSGWRGEIGFNRKCGESFLGVSFAANYTSNISSLEESNFTLITDNSSIQRSTLRTTTSIEAYGEGEFDDFHRYDINVDYAYIIPLENSKKLNLSVNPFFRHYIYHESIDFKDRTDLGIGLFAFDASKSRLLGGAFIQLNDTFNRNEKPEMETSAIDRVNFGLIVRFAFSGINIEKKDK